MRAAMMVLIALLAGLVMGSWGPRNDLRKARARIAELEKKAGGLSRDSGSVNGITSMLRIPVKENSDARHPVRRATSTETNAAPERPARFAHPGLTGEDRRKRFQENLQTAADAWKMRSDLARNSFVSNVATTQQEAASFDVLMAAMNLRLSNSISRWVETVSTNNAMTPETGIRMMSDLSSVIVLTYDQLDRTMSSGWRDHTDRNFQLFDFIDPNVALPLAEIEMSPGMRDRRGEDTEEE